MVIDHRVRIALLRRNSLHCPPWIPMRLSLPVFAGDDPFAPPTVLADFCRGNLLTISPSELHTSISISRPSYPCVGVRLFDWLVFTFCFDDSKVFDAPRTIAPNARYRTLRNNISIRSHCYIFEDIHRRSYKLS